MVEDSVGILGRDPSSYEGKLLANGFTPKFSVGDKLRLVNVTAKEHGKIFTVSQIVYCVPFRKWGYQTPWGMIESQEDLIKVD